MHGLRTDGGGQMAEDRGQNTAGSLLRTTEPQSLGFRRSEVGDQKSEIRGQKAEDR
jgi:hypothetical protein